jgi:hypothetical protein
MDIVRGATRVVTETANAATAAAGAVGGAAINGVIGAVQGTAAGIRNGVSSGSHSTPAALLTMGAIGAAGLVEWPVLLTVGGTALLVRQFSRHNGAAENAKPASTAETSARRATPTKSTRKPAKSTPRKSTRARK